MIDRRSSLRRRRYDRDLEVLGPTQNLLADDSRAKHAAKPPLPRAPDDEAADVARAGEVEDRAGDVRLRVERHHLGAQRLGEPHRLGDGVLGRVPAGSPKPA